jgi:leader peptidase (prepilin peptidase) / N-methyltransferase
MMVVGLVIGSFLNVVIYRLPIMMEREWREQCESLFGIRQQTEKNLTGPFNLIRPRSSCPHCGKLITAINNIPIISFLILKGKCRNCGKPISIRYPVVEFLCSILTGITAAHFGYQIEVLFACLLTWALISLSFIDLDHQLLPDDITLPFLWLGIVCNMFNLYTDIYSSIIGIIIGYCILWLIFIIFKFVTGKVGMGYGDFKLTAMLGAWLGWQLLPLVILLSSLLGVTVGICLILYSGHDRKIPIPFGPYLAVAGWIALIWGTDINRIYLGFI